MHTNLLFCEHTLFIPSNNMLSTVSSVNCSETIYFLTNDLKCLIYHHLFDVLGMTTVLHIIQTSLLQTLRLGPLADHQGKSFGLSYKADKSSGKMET